MIADRQVAARLVYLEPEDFTDPRRRWVFRTVRQLSVTLQTTPGNWRDLIAKTAGRSVTRNYPRRARRSLPGSRARPSLRRDARPSGRLPTGSRPRRSDGRAGRPAECRRHPPHRSQRARSGPGSRLGSLLAQVARAVRGHTAVFAPAADDPAAGEGWRSPGGTRRPGTSHPNEAERRACPVGGVQEHPQAGQILSYLPAAAFTSPARQEIFRAARRLNQSGRPVDELTVSWELAPARQ